jgi:hypothetical protein
MGEGPELGGVSMTDSTEAAAPDWANEPIQILELNTRWENALVNANIITLGELSQCSETELAAILNMGRKGIQQLKEALEYNGVRFGARKPAQKEPEPSEVDIAAAKAESLGDLASLFISDWPRTSGDNPFGLRADVHLQRYAAATQMGSLSKAARQEGCSPATVSNSIYKVTRSFRIWLIEKRARPFSGSSWDELSAALSEALSAGAAPALSKDETVKSLRTQLSHERARNSKLEEEIAKLREAPAKLQAEIDKCRARIRAARKALTEGATE